LHINVYKSLNKIKYMYIKKVKALSFLILVSVFLAGCSQQSTRQKQPSASANSMAQKHLQSGATKSFNSSNGTEMKNQVSKSEPLSYSMTGVPATVSKKTISFDSVHYLESMQDACTKHEPGYFNKVADKFDGAIEMIYEFKYQGDSQDGDYTVTILQNKPGYRTLDQFKNDFDYCAAGGDAYPEMLNGDWLVFVNACGTGVDDGSGRPHGCEEMQKIIETSLKLN
jgi:hypothetical protein